MSAELARRAMALLEQRETDLTFLDVGSRNGVQDLAGLAPHIHARGFEPNPAEYDKLITGQTDQARMMGTKLPPYRALKYFPYAIGNFCGKSSFCITPGPGACGVLEPDVARLSEIRRLSRTYDRNFGEDVFGKFDKIEVEMRTLDWLAKEEGLTHCDYLKIDVEGFEYEVLQGAAGLLPQTGVVKVEICFIPFRQGQKLFSHVDLLLREQGFDLLGYDIVQERIGYKVRELPMIYPPAGFHDLHGQPLSGDGYYVNRGLTDPQRVAAQVAVLTELGYLDEALFLAKKHGVVKDAAYLELLRTSQGSQGQRFRSAGYKLVDQAWVLLGKLRAAIGQ